VVENSSPRGTKHHHRGTEFTQRATEVLISFFLCGPLRNSVPLW
jgi:hypothetical protein